MDRYCEMLKAAMDRGEPLDASLAALRQQGASIIDSIKAVREANSVSLNEAKRLVEASSAWEGREARRPLVDEITAPHGAFSQTAGTGLFTIRDVLWLAAVMVVAAVAFWVNWRLENHNFHLRAIEKGQHRMIEQLAKENERLKKQLGSD